MLAEGTMLLVVSFRLLGLWLVRSASVGEEFGGHNQGKGYSHGRLSHIARGITDIDNTVGCKPYYDPTNADCYHFGRRARKIQCKPNYDTTDAESYHFGRRARKIQCKPNYDTTDADCYHFGRRAREIQCKQTLIDTYRDQPIRCKLCDRENSLQTLEVFELEAARHGVNQRKSQPLTSSWRCTEPQ